MNDLITCRELDRKSLRAVVGIIINQTQYDVILDEAKLTRELTQCKQLSKAAYRATLKVISKV